MRVKTVQGKDGKYFRVESEGVSSMVDESRVYKLNNKKDKRGQKVHYELSTFDHDRIIESIESGDKKWLL